MFKSYADIFDQRGKDYHQAMARFPVARAQEFEKIIGLADLHSGQCICDIPSGGGYLAEWIPSESQWICVDTSRAFHTLLFPGHTLQSCYCEHLGHIPLASAGVDRIISLAGLHHVSEREQFYHEAFRLLKPGGKMAIADAFAGSGVDGFLNDFVHRHSTLGHEGDFLDVHEGSKLQQQGFQILFAESIFYHWVFPSELDMASFCQQLFGIDQASLDDIREAIAHYLGYDLTPTACRMNWSLYFLQVQKEGV